MSSGQGWSKCPKCGGFSLVDCDCRTWECVILKSSCKCEPLTKSSDLVSISEEEEEYINRMLYGE